MTTLTFLGAHGGAGTTTMAALSLHLMAMNGIPVPSWRSHDRPVFAARVGTAPFPAVPAQNELVDGGRYSARAASEAFSSGSVVLVGARTPRGLSQLDDALADIAAKFGRSGYERLIVVVNAAYGASSLRMSDPAVAVPFDRRLAAGGALQPGLEGIGKRTSRVFHDSLLPRFAAAYRSR